MATGKDSFILYTKYVHVARKLSDEMAGKLYKMILEYVNDTDPQTDDLVLDLLFEPIKQDLKEDLRKWEAVCERNRENGKAGGRPRKAENNPENPVGYLGTQKTQTNPLEPKKPRRTRYDSDSDSDMSIDSDMKKEEHIHEKTKFDIFNEWLKKTYPTVSKLKRQMTENELQTIIEKYGRTSLNDILMQMENKADLNKKYTSVYLTANNWLQRGTKK